MIGLALRMAIRGGREAIVRLAMISVGVAVGVGMLFAAVAGFNAAHAQTVRTAWLATSERNVRPGAAGSDGLWWRASHDEYQGHQIDRVDIAVTGPNTPRLPGIAVAPGPGENIASPALTRLIASVAPDELGNRFGGRNVAVLGAAGMASPDDLIIVVGHAPNDLAGKPATVEVHDIETSAPTQTSTTFEQVVLGIGAAGLLFPILTFIGTATRLAAARRQERLAAMRLAGASPGQIGVIAACEASIATAVGALGGLVLFSLLRGTIATVGLTGSAWFASDVSVGALAAAGLIVAVIVSAGFASVLSVHRAGTSPLEVSRHSTPPPLSLRRLIPLAVGVAMLGVFALAGHPYQRGAAGTYAPALVAAFILTMAGVVAAAPVVIAQAAHRLANHAGRPATLIAARRLDDNPTAAFRAVSGLILAVFVGSVFIGATGSASSASGFQSDAAANHTVIMRTPNEDNGTVDNPADKQLFGAVATLPGIIGSAEVYRDPAGVHNQFPTVLVDCNQLRTVPELGSCPPNSVVIAMPQYALDAGHTQPGTTWPASETTPAQLAGTPVVAWIANTNGTTTALERLRTTIDIGAPFRFGSIATLTQISASTMRDIFQLQHLIDIGMLITVIIAGCSLAVAVTAGLIERRRAFTLLRLAGTPISTLRATIVLEAIVPLTVLATASATAGLLTSALLLRAVRGTTITLPGPSYYLAILTGLTVASLLVLTTMPILKRISDPQHARTE